MLAVDVSDTMCRDRMAQILDAAKPFVQAYVKHTRTGINLSFGCNFPGPVCTVSCHAFRC